MTLNISVVQHSRDPQGPPDVEDIQARLRAKGLYPYRPDGIYGDVTRKGVIRFQALEGFRKDGIVGPVTWGRLRDSNPSRPARSEAARFADLMYRICAGDGIDGRRPRYDFGHEVSMHDPSPDAWDCSEATQWAVTQIDGHTWVDGSANQWRACTRVSLATAKRTKGALVFSSSNGRVSGIHHVAVSMGNGRTAEARSTARGCGSWDINDGRFNMAGLIPVLRYAA